MEVPQALWTTCTSAKSFLQWKISLSYSWNFSHCNLWPLPPTLLLNTSKKSLHHLHNPSLGSAVKSPWSVFSIQNKPSSFSPCSYIMCSSDIMVLVASTELELVCQYPFYTQGSKWLQWHTAASFSVSSGSESPSCYIINSLRWETDGMHIERLWPAVLDAYSF